MLNDSQILINFGNKVMCRSLNEMIFPKLEPRPGHFQFLPLSVTVKGDEQQKCPGLA